MNDDERVRALNARQTIRIVLVLLMSFASYFICVAFPEATTVLAVQVGKVVPSIEKLLQSPSLLGTLPARYFALNAALLPFYVALLVWNEAAGPRFRFGLSRSGRSRTEAIFILYFLFLPLCIGLLLAVIVAPIDLPHEPRLWGQHALGLVFNFNLGLFSLGSLLVAAIAVTLAMLIFVLWLPIEGLLESLRKGKEQ
jgi:uncharacterized membrane protein